MKRIRDPIHGFIQIRDDEVQYLDDPIVQRLRRIKQLGFDHYVYPGAVHDRFSHSLGVLHITERIVETLSKRGISVDEKAVRLAALLHDIGHTPLSHTLEIFLREHYGLLHEEYTHALLEGMGLEVIDTVFRSNSLEHNIISGEVDADRMDYLIRDAYYCGVKYGEYDLDRLIQGITAIDGKLAVLYKARYALQNFVLARFLMYLQVYMHKTSAGFSVAAAKAMERINEKYPYPTPDELISDPYKIVKYDDPRFYERLKELSMGSDKYAIIAKQLLNRKRFKIVFQKEISLHHNYYRDTDAYPYRYVNLLNNRELLREHGGLLYAPEFAPLAPPYIGGTDSIIPVVMPDGSLEDIRLINPVLKALSEHYTLILRVYAIEGYEKSVEKVVKEILSG